MMQVSCSLVTFCVVGVTYFLFIVSVIAIDVFIIWLHDVGLHHEAKSLTPSNFLRPFKRSDKLDLNIEYDLNVAAETNSVTFYGEIF